MWHPQWDKAERGCAYVGNIKTCGCCGQNLKDDVYCFQMHSFCSRACRSTFAFAQPFKADTKEVKYAGS